MEIYIEDEIDIFSLAVIALSTLPLRSHAVYSITIRISLFSFDVHIIFPGKLIGNHCHQFYGKYRKFWIRKLTRGTE